MPDQSLNPLHDLDGVQEATLTRLREAGFESLEDLADATRTGLRDVDDISTSTAVNILRFLEREGYREPREVTENQKQLQELLRDLFQFDAADLDFGIYRILNQRRDIIEEFLEEDLIRTVHDALEEVATEERQELQEEVEEARQEVIENLDEEVFTPEGEIKEEYRSFGVAQDYIEARERLEQYEIAEETEARIFNDLYKFFSRFYDRGDFHIKRRFSSQDAKFMVPYNGEEVFFHWANRDQYYVKTSEHFTTYRFDADDLTVEFTVEDANVPQDNVKGDERYFILGTDPVTWDEDNRQLTVTFQYRLITEDEADEFVDIYNEVTGEDRSSFNHKTNTILCTALHQQILDHLDAAVPRETLQQEDDGDTVLMQHLTRYTSENTMDYFIHKDLGGFLHDELDYYIQNEILDTEELVAADADRDPRSLLRARVVRKIADRIITFLDQVEDFQKRLFEKRKFVTQTDYMVTLDKVPSQLYDDILANEDQLEQWHDVYNTDEWQGDLSWQGEFTEAVLEDNPYLMIDTALFDDEFKHELLASFDDIEEATDGTLIHGENFQALNLLTDKYRNEVRCTYIDPPYNTGKDDFVYKDRYEHSTWLSMMDDRLRLSKDFLSKEGSFFVSLDDNEQAHSRVLLDSVFGEHNFAGNIVWQKRTSPDHRATLGAAHDYILSYAENWENFKEELGRLPLTEERKSEYTNPDDDPRGPWASVDITGQEGHATPDQFYEITTPGGETYEPPEGRCWAMTNETFQELREDNRIWFGDDGNARPRLKKFLSEAEGRAVWTWWPNNEVGHNQEATRRLLDLFGEDMGYQTPKPVRLLKRIFNLTTDDASESLCLDFFAGSGTTAESVIGLNREGGNQNYLLVEMADYFDDLIKPRIQKVVFTPNWTDGIPSREAEEGITHMVKYHRIESYEDALNNVILEEPEDEEQQRIVDEQREEYVSGYMLDFEVEGPSLMEPVSFEHPFDYELDIERNGTGPKPVSVDLVETFHYLIGAEVNAFETFEHQDRQYVTTQCSVETENGVDNVLTIWRDTDELDLEQERDWFTEQFEPAEFDRVYINTESFIPSAEPVEVTFKERMEASYDGAE